MFQTDTVWIRIDFSTLIENVVVLRLIVIFIKFRRDDSFIFISHVVDPNELILNVITNMTKEQSKMIDRDIFFTL